MSPKQLLWLRDQVKKELRGLGLDGVLLTPAEAKGLECLGYGSIVERRTGTNGDFSKFFGGWSKKCLLRLVVKMKLQQKMKEKRELT